MQFDCIHCGKINIIKSDKKKKELITTFTENEIIKKNTLDLPLYIQVIHNGFWITENGKHKSTTDIKCDRNSVILNPECLLYVYKLAFRHLLLSMKIITPTDIDSQNLVPHIVVRKNKNDSHSNYDSIQNEYFVINEEDLSAKTDFLLLELDKKRNLHITMCYSKQIGKRINLTDAFKHVIKILNTKPELIEQYKQLKYFGEKEIEYWFNTPDSFPNKINIPTDYKLKINNNTIPTKTTVAGSIILI